MKKNIFDKLEYNRSVYLGKNIDVIKSYVKRYLDRKKYVDIIYGGSKIQNVIKTNLIRKIWSQKYVSINIIQSSLKYKLSKNIYNQNNLIFSTNKLCSYLRYNIDNQNYDNIRKHSKIIQKYYKKHYYKRKYAVQTIT